MINKQIRIFLILALTIASIVSAGQKLPAVKFEYRYTAKGDSQNLILFVQNMSKTKKIFYTIGLQGYKDNSWHPLLSDINSLGQNEFLGLTELGPKKVATKKVSLTKVFYLFADKKLEGIKFDLIYHLKPSFDSESVMVSQSKLTQKS